MMLTRAHRSGWKLAAAVAVAAACRGPSITASHGNSPTVGLKRLQALEGKLLGTPAAIHAARMSAGYDDAFADATMDGITDDELADWYDAAFMVAFYTQDPARANTLASTLTALEHRGRANDRQYASMYETYVGARMFDDARQLVQRHPMPRAEALPSIRDIEPIAAGAPSLWVVDPSGREITHRAARVSEGVQVVVISHPTCHFSQQAITALEQDPDLRQVLSEHAIWLAPPANHLDLEEISQWNKLHPGLNTLLAVRRDEWPMFDTWGTPTFYFLDRGAVVAKVEGWPKEGRQAELRATMQRLGLLP